MRKEIVVYSCDICGNQKELKEIKQINYPVIFTTDQTEGRSCDPYISQEKIDVCQDCLSKICRVCGEGAQGFNKYRICQPIKKGDENA